MKNRAAVTTLLALVAGLACGAPGDGEAPPADVAEQAVADAALLRTGDPYARGLTDADFPRIKQLAGDVYSYEALHRVGDETITTVSMIVVTSEGVLVADGQGSVEDTRRMVEEIGGITDQPITHVVIASDHGDHTAGNAAFPRTAAFIAHPDAAAVLQERVGRPDAPEVVLPTELVEDSRTLDLGGREIRIEHLGRGHTSGDLVVYLPAEKILFMSEAYLNRIFPAVRGGYPSESLASLAKAQAMDVELYVPGHGFVDSPEVLEEELENYRRAIEQVVAEGRRLHAAGVPVEDAMRQARFGELEDWTLRSVLGGPGIERVYLELNGELPPR